MATTPQPRRSKRLGRHEAVPEADLYFRTAPVFQNDSPPHKGLAEDQFVGAACAVGAVAGLAIARETRRGHRTVPRVALHPVWVGSLMTVKESEILDAAGDPSKDVLPRIQPPPQPADVRQTSESDLFATEHSVGVIGYPLDEGQHPQHEVAPERREAVFDVRGHRGERFAVH